MSRLRSVTKCTAYPSYADDDDDDDDDDGHVVDNDDDDDGVGGDQDEGDDNLTHQSNFNLNWNGTSSCLRLERDGSSSAN